MRQVWAAYSPAARHGAEVTHTLNKGLTSLRAHEECLKGLGQPDFDHELFLEQLAREAGNRMGCRFAVAFAVITIAG
ncbi:hypothetical protein ONO86_01318 [Micromonospora noduli]|uniref:hypothetical protein n=1 Tax=Micromonospora noduli TaxID=709876 RepID=UPI000DC3BD71|nr:hypothetical protein [Micromonospora noduli]RAO53812.1 hypothetical protein ONO86_01318 [Micromonospora noduli]